MTGCRISFVAGNAAIIQKFNALRSQIDYGIFFPIQHAAIAALSGPQDVVLKNRAAYKARRDALCGGLRSIGWNVPDAQATMFAWFPIPDGFANSNDFALELLEKTGVVCVPETVSDPWGRDLCAWRWCRM
jgi:LL-diaminopimelate aminotransferase